MVNYHKILETKYNNTPTPNKYYFTLQLPYSICMMQVLTFKVVMIPYLDEVSQVKEYVEQFWHFKWTHYWECLHQLGHFHF